MTTIDRLGIFKNEPELQEDILPQPQLWRILVRPMPHKEKTSGGVYLADETKEADRYNDCRALVMSMGPLAYTGDNFRPHPDAQPIPACKVGDWITVGKYAGQSVTVNGATLLIVNDDNVTSVIPDPRALKAYV
jgi:co-chaperonin GroES (HSP10)